MTALCRLRPRRPAALHRFCGLFTRLWSPFADFVYIGLPLYIDFRSLFTWLWSRFTDSVYVGSPLDIDSCGFFRRL
jgi:hypothetical protein